MSTSSAQIDPRGPQFTAAVTVVVLAVVLLVAPHPAGVVLLGVQAVLFALAAGLGVQRTPHAWVFRTVLRPRLGAPAELEDAAPPRFAQAVGLAFAVVGLIGYLSGATLLGAVAVGFALAAALLNAAFGFCLGCEVYLLLKRITDRSGLDTVAAQPARPTTSAAQPARPTTSAAQPARPTTSAAQPARPTTSAASIHRSHR